MIRMIEAVRVGCAHEGPARRVDGLMPALCRIVQMVEAPIW
jgi:hypothetical protein